MLNCSPRSKGVTGVVTCAPTERSAVRNDVDAALATPGEQRDDTRHLVDVYTYTRIPA